MVASATTVVALGGSIDDGKEEHTVKFISPQQLNDDPKRWLDVPHKLHESLVGLQERLFPGFKQKLMDEHIHCLKCEGEKPFEVITRDTLKHKVCTGYIGEPGNVELLKLVDIKEAEGVTD